MKRSRFTEEQIAATLKQGEAGMKASDLCRQTGIREATYYLDELVEDLLLFGMTLL